VAQHRPREGIVTLTAVRDEVRSAQNHYGALRLTTQMAIALFSANEPAEASTVLRGVVAAAASAGIQQTILEPGAEIGPLLLCTFETPQRTDFNGKHAAYIQNLLSRWRARYHQDFRAASTPEVREPVSVRERAVLELIGEGRSNKEIARALDIAPETVKSHVKNIFMKLGVEKRAQAVTRAQSLGLVRTQWQ
jgi:LuxR family maltose regulon positive regulatory protein